MNQILGEKLAKLESETEVLFKSVDQLSEEALHDQAYGWSIIQVLAHLIESEAGSVMYMTKKMQAGDKMPEYTLGNKMKMAFTKAMLGSSLKWKAPKFVANPNSELSLAEIKENWEVTRKQTRTYVQNYPEQYLNKAVYKHPMAGRLDLASAIDSLTYHQIHHRHQIERIKKVIG